MNTLRGLVCAFAAGLGMASAVPAQAGDAAWPFVQPPIDTLRASHSKVFAHYFPPFPLWLWNPLADNNSKDDGTHDIYQETYLNPDGTGGVGGYLRERPLPAAAPSLTDQNSWEMQNAELEVQRAVALGLDGFAIDILYDQGDGKGDDWHRVKTMMQAAINVDPDGPGHTGFKILLMPDMSTSWTSDPTRLKTAIATLGNYASAYRVPTCKDSFNNTLNNCLVVAPFDAGRQNSAWWNTWKLLMQTSGTDNVALLPLFINWWNYSSPQQGYKQISYGYSDWGVASSAAQYQWATQGAQAHAAGPPLWMGPVRTQDFRPKENTMQYWENSNSRAFRDSWDNAICDGGSSPGVPSTAGLTVSNGATAFIAGACGSGTSTSSTEWVQVETWNDYSENSEISPSSRTQYAFYDLTAYYTAWFKTRMQPAITQDVIYYFYRRHKAPADLPSAVPSLQKPATPQPPLHPGDAPSDKIELLAFLTANATLRIDDGTGNPNLPQVVVSGVPAGGEIVSVTVPLPPTTTAVHPTFVLLRGTPLVPVITLSGASPVCNTFTHWDLLYQAGSSSRPPLTGIAQDCGTY